VDRLARGGMLIAGGGYAGSIEIGYEQLVLALESVSRAAGAEARRGDCAAVPNLATSGRPDPPTSRPAPGAPARAEPRGRAEAVPQPHARAGGDAGRYKGIGDVLGPPTQRLEN
jgi:hypothetical protein